ncbi:MAG TPA: hypothetical protein VGE67_05295 [Haloferula sp.]
MVKPLALFLIAATAGYLAGRPNRESAAPTAPANSRESVAKQKRAHWEVQDFSEWISSPVKNPADRMPVTAPPDLSEWSAQELRNALDAAMGPGMSTISQKEWYQLVGLLMEEWASRDFDAVTGWFESMPSAEMQRTVDGILGSIWPADRGEDALDFVIRNGLNNTAKGGISYPIFLNKAISAAAKKSPAAVARVVAKAAENGMESRYSHDAKFPDGFDFAALASQPQLADLVAKGYVFFAGEWAAQDLKGAFDHLVAKPGRVDQAIISSLLSEAMARHEVGDSALLSQGYALLAGQTSAMDPEAAEKLVVSLISNHHYAQNSAVELGGFVGGLTDSELRKKAAHQAAKQVTQWTMAGGQLIDFLERSGPPEERLETIRYVMVDNASRNSYGLMPRDETLLRQRLGEWGVPADQADQLVNDIKTAPRK